MKRAKKWLALLLTGLMVFAMTACGSDSGSGDSGSDSESDMEYVQDKGTLVVGIINFEPMDYQDENGEWIGFDAESGKGFRRRAWAWTWSLLSAVGMQDHGAGWKDHRLRGGTA